MRPMSRSGRIDQGDSTQDVGATTGEGTAGASVLLVAGLGTFSSHALAGAELVIGRAADCDVRVDHSALSRRHARLHLGPPPTIQDLGSRNGTRVSGQVRRGGEPVALRSSDSFHIGPFSFVLVAGSSAVVLAGAAGESAAPRGALMVSDPTLAGKTDLLERIARASVNVIVQGETGTGKEVLAQTIHALSGRPGEIVAINCAALGGNLLESELFGHERGAFTGAVKTKPGLLEIAGNSTALLDEIGELPLDLQSKLLRALESRQVHRVGGTKPIEIHCRVIAATHRDLPAEIAAGRFRQDLYYRLHGITLAIPPLRARREMIGPLATRFLDEARPRCRARFTPTALVALGAHDWPGNVRELRRVIERAVLLAGDAPIDAAHLLLAPMAAPAPTAAPPESDDRGRFLALARSCRGNTSAIARALETSRSQVKRLADRYGIDLDGLR